MRDRILTWLADNVPPARIKHILGVEQMSIELAQYYHLDQKHAAVAGLMHDMAKYFKPNLLLEIANNEGVEIDSVCRANPHLLHADVSAIVARKEFGIEDETILEAIALHTLGSPGMSKLSCVVFIADSIEPSRGNTPELAALREVAKQDLYKGMWLTCDYSSVFFNGGLLTKIAARYSSHRSPAHHLNAKLGSPSVQPKAATSKLSDRSS